MDINMDLLDWLAIYAAIVSTVTLYPVLLKDIFRLKKLNFMAYVEWDSARSAPMINIMITNTGHRTLTVAKIIPTSPNLKEGKLTSPEGLPATLQDGETTIVKADIALGGEGWYFLEAEDSTGKRYRMPELEHSKLKASVKDIAARYGVRISSDWEQEYLSKND